MLELADKNDWRDAFSGCDVGDPRRPDSLGNSAQAIRKDPACSFSVGLRFIGCLGAWSVSFMVAELIVEYFDDIGIAVDVTEKDMGYFVQ